MKSVLLVFILMCSAFFTFGTAQIPDIIHYKGMELSLHTNPLEAYFEKHPDKRPKGGISSTALWRGYRATFEIISNRLVLKDIEVQQVTEKERDRKVVWKSVINEVFQDQRNRTIDWFTGLLVLPYGDQVTYVHLGYGSTYENYYLIEIKNGTFIQDRALTNKQYIVFKEKQFQEFKKTDAYKVAVNQLKKDGDMADGMIDDFLRDYLDEYTSEILVAD